jgi:hypothetical protein
MIDREIAVPSYEEIKAARAVLTDDCIVDLQRGVAPAENIIKRRSGFPAPMPSQRLQSGTSRIFGPLDQLISDSVVCLSGTRKHAELDTADISVPIRSGSYLLSLNSPHGNSASS